MIDDKVCYNGKKERREGRKIAKTVPGGKGDLSGKASLLSTFAWRGNCDKMIAVLRTVVIFSRGVYQNNLPCSTGDWSLLYLCNVRLPLGRDDRQNSRRGPWDMNARCVLVTLVGGSYLVKCSLVRFFKDLIYLR